MDTNEHEGFREEEIQPLMHTDVLEGNHGWHGWTRMRERVHGWFFFLSAFISVHQWFVFGCGLRLKHAIKIPPEFQHTREFLG
jgi:hypothetical protein